MTTQNAQAVNQEKLASLQALIASTGFASNPKTPAQEKASINPNGAPGLQSGLAGQKADSPTWQYATSSLVNGRSFRTNAAGLRNSLLALSISGEPTSHRGMASAIARMNGRVTEDSMWCGSRDLIDLGLATFTYMGQKKLVALTEKGAEHLINILKAETALKGEKLWLCHAEGVFVKCDRDNTIVVDKKGKPITMKQVEALLLANAQKEAVTDTEGEGDEEEETTQEPEAQNGDAKPEEPKKEEEEPKKEVEKEEPPKASSKKNRSKK